MRRRLKPLPRLGRLPPLLRLGRRLPPLLRLRRRLPPLLRLRRRPPPAKTEEAAAAKVRRRRAAAAAALAATALAAAAAKAEEEEAAAKTKAEEEAAAAAAKAKAKAEEDAAAAKAEEEEVFASPSTSEHVDDGDDEDPIAAAFGSPAVEQSQSPERSEEDKLLDAASSIRNLLTARHGAAYTPEQYDAWARHIGLSTGGADYENPPLGHPLFGGVDIMLKSPVGARGRSGRLAQAVQARIDAERARDEEAKKSELLEMLDDMLDGASAATSPRSRRRPLPRTPAGDARRRQRRRRRRQRRRRKRRRTTRAAIPSRRRPSSRRS